MYLVKTEVYFRKSKFILSNQNLSVKSKFFYHQNVLIQSKFIFFNPSFSYEI